MKTENELGNSLSEAELDDVRGGVELLELLRREQLDEQLKSVTAAVIDRLAVMDFSPIKPFVPGGILGRLQRPVVE